MSHEVVKGEYTTGAPAVLQVPLVSDANEDGAERVDQKVVAPFYLLKKMGNQCLFRLRKPCSPYAAKEN